MSSLTLPGRPGSWRTWAGTSDCRPLRIVTPASEADIGEAVHCASRIGVPVRVAGTGHSFNALACTEGILVDMSGFSGVLDLDPLTPSVTVRAGTSLRLVNAVLERAGLALANTGTLAEQTIAGAISTGNHGTGLAHGPFSSQVTGLRMVAADGVVRMYRAHDCPDLLRCARTSLGALGVITEVTLRCVPRFNLRTISRSEPLDAVLERFEDWAASADHISLGWLPWTDTAVTRALHRTEEPRAALASLLRHRATLDEVRCGLAGWADASWLPAGGRPRSYVDVSHRLLSFRQPVPLIALEHALPLTSTAQALNELRPVLRRLRMRTPYPLLVRVGAADDAPLSPAYGHQTGYVNVTVPRHPAYTSILRATERVLSALGARPHWGKAHTQTAETLRPRYPEWDRFQALRDQLDPYGLFTTPYLARVLGTPSPSWAGLPPPVGGGSGWGPP